MARVHLPYGPWKSLLVGSYEGKDVSIYTNPQKDMLYVVVDKDEEGKTRGLVISVYRPFFVQEGDPVTLITHISGHPVSVIKKWKGEMYKFVIVPAGIKYIGVDPSELRDTVEEMVATLNRMDKNIAVLSRTLGIKVKPFTSVPSSVSAILFSEPSTIAGLLPSYGKSEDSEEGLAVLGTLKNGSPATEPLINLRRVIVYGHKEGRKNMFYVLIEEMLKHGVNVIVITGEPSKYTYFSKAGKKDEMLVKLGVEPEGFAVEFIEQGIDVKYLDPVDVVLTGGEVEKEVFEAMSEVIVKLKSGEGMKRGEIDQKTLEANRYLLSLISGVNKVNYPIPSITKRSGRGTLYIVKYKGLEGLLFLYSLINGVVEGLKRRGKKEIPVTVLAVENAERLFSNNDTLQIKKFVAYIQQGKDVGLGWLLEAEKDVNIHNILLGMTETKIGAIDSNDVGVRTLLKKPYRMNIRPFASAIGEYQAPSVSSQQAPLPDHK